MFFIDLPNFNRIVEFCKNGLPNESCGLLAGEISENVKIVKKVYFLKNLDESPNHFSMAPEEQFAAIKDIRANNWQLLGNFHSHPNSPARMSNEDLRLAFDTNLTYFILSLQSQPILKAFTIDKAKNVSEVEILIK